MMHPKPQFRYVRIVTFHLKNLTTGWRVMEQKLIERLSGPNSNSKKVNATSAAQLSLQKTHRGSITQRSWNILSL